MILNLCATQNLLLKLNKIWIWIRIKLKGGIHIRNKTFRIRYRYNDIWRDSTSLDRSQLSDSWRRIDPVDNNRGVQRPGCGLVGRADEPDTRRIRRIPVAQQLDLKVQLVEAVLDGGEGGPAGAGVVPAHQSQVVPVQLVVDLGLHPLGLSRPPQAGRPVDEAGEGVGDGEVVRVGVPLAGQVAADVLVRQVGVEVEDEHGRGWDWKPSGRQVNILILIY